MNYYSAKDLASSFRTVRKNTLQVAEDIPESQYGFSAAPNTRTVEKLLTHIALASNFQHHVQGVERLKTPEDADFRSLRQQIRQQIREMEAEPRTKAQVIDLLTTEGEKWAAFVENLEESVLAEVTNMRPNAVPASGRSRFDMIASVKEHEMHHRGQLMLIERMIGIVPHLTRKSEERAKQAQARG